MSEKADKSPYLKDAHMPSVTPHGRNIMYLDGVLLTAVNEDVAVVVAQNMNAHNDLLVLCADVLRWTKTRHDGMSFFPSSIMERLEAATKPATPPSPSDVQPVDDTGDRGTGDG